MNLSGAYSPCPNDTFTFNDVAGGRVGRSGDPAGDAGIGQ